MRKLGQLFFEFFKISLFVVGGGYAIIVVADEVSARKGWTEEGEIIDRLGVFQMIPGLIATHSAVYVGNKVAGAAGAAISVFAVALPAIVIFLFISVGYASLPLDIPCLQGVFMAMRASLTGIIASTLMRGWKRNLPDAFSYSLMALAAFAILVLHVNIALVVAVAIVMGVISVSADGEAKKFRSSLLPLLLFTEYGLLCFGGGFAIVPMYLEDFVGPSAPYLQISLDDFSNVMALSQMTPGPVGVNAATFFGYRIAGVFGSLISSLLLLLPGSVLVFFAVRSLERFKSSRVVAGIMRGVRPASVALMLAALKAFVFIDPTPVFGIIAVVTALLLYYRKLKVMHAIALSALIGLAL